MLGVGCGVWGMGCEVCGVGFEVWGLGIGVWVLGFGIWDLRFGVWVLKDLRIGTLLGCCRGSVHLLLEGRYKATWKTEFQYPWRKAGLLESS